jgi:hypothetical protein
MIALIILQMLASASLVSYKYNSIAIEKKKPETY